MLTNPTLRSQVDALWDKLWTGGLSNPLDAIEQFSFLLFLKRLDEREQSDERSAKLRGRKFTPVFTDPTLRWSYWTQLGAADALKHVKEQVFPFIKTLGGKGGSFAAQMENAEFKINKPSLLIEACHDIDQMEISAQNQDVQGDLYEYLLSKLNTAGTNGQFRTPRHIIRMMVKMVDPQPRERVVDPAAGTCGFLVNVWQHLLETHTDLGQFVVAGADAAEAFDPAEEVFNPVAEPVVAAVKGGAESLPGFRRQAGAQALVLQPPVERSGGKALVPDNPTAVQDYPTVRQIRATLTCLLLFPSKFSH